MDNPDVRIVRLEPMRVASFLGYGPSPEQEAFDKLYAWARPRGLLDDRAAHRLFGFDNPPPSAGSPNYGYETWIVVDPDTPPEDGVRIVDVPGGLYAVTRCVVPKGFFDAIGRAWRKLVAWREDSPYKCGGRQCLEESLPLTLPDTEFARALSLSSAASPGGGGRRPPPRADIPMETLERGPRAALQALTRRGRRGMMGSVPTVTLARDEDPDAPPGSGRSRTSRPSTGPTRPASWRSWRPRPRSARPPGHRPGPRGCTRWLPQPRAIV